MTGWLGMKDRVKAEGRFRTAWPVDSCKSIHTVAHFRQLEDGSTLFYPPGAFGRRGFRVESDPQEHRLRRAAGIYRNLCVAVGLGLGFLVMAIDFHEWPSANQAAVFVGSLVLGWLSARFFFWPMTRTMERVNIPNAPVIYWRHLGETLNPIWLVLMIIYCGAMIGLLIWLFLRDGEPISLLYAGFFAVLFVPPLVGLIHRCLVRWRNVS